MRRFRALDAITGFVVIAFLGMIVVAAPPAATPQPASWDDQQQLAEEKRLDRIDHMVDSGVKVLYRGGHGSGILFVRGNEVYILTAAHVIVNRRMAIRPWLLLPEELQPNPKLTYGTSTIFIQRHRQDETTFANDVYIAELIVADGSTDAAILRIKHATPKNFPGLEGGASFDLRNNKSLRRGMKTIHVGNFNDSIEAVTEGIISNPQQPLRYGTPPLPKFRVIQTTNMVAPGSSGGGVYLESTGECIGVLVRTSWMPGDALVIPVYEIDQWLNSVSDEMGELLEQPEQPE